MKSPLYLLLLSASVMAPLPAQAGPAHQHGLARLDVAVEAQRVTVYLETPLDNLLGFERAPRTAAERQQADAAVARLKDGAKLFRIDDSAGCKLAEVTLTSAALGLPAPGAPVAKGEHADLEGRFEFSCTAGARANFVEVGLFGVFARMKRIELQLVSPKGQMKATLVRPASRVALVR